MRFIATCQGTVRSVRWPEPAAWLGVAVWLGGLGLAQAATANTESAVYRVDESTQVIHLTDNPPPQSKERQHMLARSASASPAALALPARAGQTFGDTLRPTTLEPIVHAAAHANRLDPALLHALISVESGYAAHAVSRKGAQGLMQLMPSTARDYGVTNAFDPHQNVPAGARHLRELLDQFNDDTTLALAAYNAGAGAVWKHGLRVPPYAETLAYVPKVLARWAALRTQRALHAPPGRTAGTGR